MANDFFLFIVDWTRFESHFESSPLARMDESEWQKLSHPERAAAAVESLTCLRESDFSISLSDITPFHSASESFHLWGALGGTYSEIRRYLAIEDREVYDEMYFPFIGPFVDKREGSRDPFELHDKLTHRLKDGGLCLALEPGSCKSMSELFRHYSFSRLVHEVLALRSFPPPLPNVPSFFHDMIDGVETEMGHLHASYTEMTEGWRILTQQASHRKWGIIGTYQI